VTETGDTRGAQQARGQLKIGERLVFQSLSLLVAGKWATDGQRRSVGSAYAKAKGRGDGVRPVMVMVWVRFVVSWLVGWLVGWCSDVHACSLARLGGSVGSGRLRGSDGPGGACFARSDILRVLGRWSRWGLTTACDCVWLVCGCVGPPLKDRAHLIML